MCSVEAYYSKTLYFNKTEHYTFQLGIYILVLQRHTLLSQLPVANRLASADTARHSTPLSCPLNVTTQSTELPDTFHTHSIADWSWDPLETKGK